jgi:glycosyltransferase involved in cell wall biosynthesis
LRAAVRLRGMTRSCELAEMTISMLEGREGRQAKELERLIEWLADQPPADVFILPNSLFAGLAGPLRQRFGVPVVSLLSGEDTFVESFPEPHRSRAMEVLRRRVAELDGMIALSAFYADHMSQWLGAPRDRIEVVVLGLDLNPYRELTRTEPEVFTIGYRSPICEAQGLRVLAEAFALLKRRPETAHCRLRAAGYLEPAERPYLEQIVADLRHQGFDKDFEYVGELNAAERIEFVAGLSVFCAPPVYPEPFALFVPEALAAGVPVVASRAGCLPEWIEATGGGILCAPNDAAGLAEALARLAADPALARALGERGQATVRSRNSAEAMAGSLLDALAQFRSRFPRRQG